jgi:DNA-binding LacI/PurR family transcriptional regulator
MSNTNLASAPKYSQLADRFRRRIESGELKVGDRLPSYVDMRRLHGVSRPTMDKVLDLLEAEGVVAREPGRGVFVAQPASVRARGVIGVLGGLGDDANRHPYFTHILEGIHEAADRERVQILLLSPGARIEWEKVDGVLTCAIPQEDNSQRLPPGMPFVRIFTTSPDCSCVITDDKRGAYDATKHLISLGHRRIGYLSSAIYSAIARNRYNGYLEALREAGISPNKKWLREIDFTRPDMRDGYMECSEKIMEEWLRTDWKSLGCTALLTANDDSAIGAMQALRVAGLRVPDDVSIVGFDGTEVSRYASPRLTTVEVPLREISAKGTALLLQKMAQRVGASLPDPQLTVLPPRLIVRESTAPPPTR